MSYPNAKLMNLEDGQKLLEAIDQHKAEKNGAYEDLTAGNALYLLSDRGDTDVAPYVFRKTGGAKNGYGREFLRKIVGGTVAWNQLVQNGNFESSSGWGVVNGTLSVSGNIATLTVTGAATQFYRNVPCIENHVYLTSMKANHSQGGKQIALFGAAGNKYVTSIANSWIDIAFIDKAGSTTAREFNARTDATSGDTIKYRDAVAFDLTQMFGSTIADAIYAMEQAAEGSGVAWFRSLFPNSYYAYDAGSLQSVQAKEHRTVGKNLIDISSISTHTCINSAGGVASSTWCNLTDYIPVFPGKTYYMSHGIGTSALNGGAFYTNEKTYINKILISGNNDASFAVTIPDDCYYVRININDRHVEIAQFEIGSVATEYEPYEEHTYPLDSTLTLRGIPAWDSTNGLYYDGDEYTPGGSVKRKYGIVDLGTLTWAYDSGNVMMYAPFAVCAVGTLGLICGKYYTAYRYYGGIVGATSGIHMDSNMNLYIKDPAYTDAATFKTAMSGVYLVYELATPTTETADPYRELQISAHGGTEEFVDAGVTASTPTRDVSVPVGTETFYPIDVVAYIEELTNPDHDMVADALIPSGKYFMVGNSLYKSTSQIQAGATIIPGSNCTAKNLAEALNELNT